MSEYRVEIGWNMADGAYLLSAVTVEAQSCDSAMLKAIDKISAGGERIRPENIRTAEATKC